MPKLKSLLASGVSSVCRVTGPPVNKGAFTGWAGISEGLCTFIGAFSFQVIVPSSFLVGVYLYLNVLVTGRVGMVRSACFSSLRGRRASAHRGHHRSPPWRARPWP